MDQYTLATAAVAAAATRDLRLSPLFCSTRYSPAREKTEFGTANIHLQIRFSITIVFNAAAVAATTGDLND